MSNQYYNEQINIAINYIEMNICESITVVSVSEQTSFSKWEFQRIFRAYVGDSIGGYIRGRRLSLAVVDLQSTSKKIIDIALKYQFSSQESFSRSVKAFFGYTPGHIRQKNLSLKSKLKPFLNETRVIKISESINKDPKFIVLENKKLIGIKTIFESTLGSNESSFNQITKLWEKFHQLSKDSNSLKKNINYGLISAPSDDFNQDHLEYFAGSEFNNQQEVPDEMHTIEIKNQKYTLFEINGKSDSCHIIAEYIYGIWLPQSEYKRSLGFDIEIFDTSVFSYYKENSKYFYCIPVKSKEKL